MARTDTLEGEVYISGVQKFCCSAGFSQRLEYQRPKRVPITPSAFVQRLNIQINVSGNITPLAGLQGTLTGISHRPVPCLPGKDRKRKCHKPVLA